MKNLKIILAIIGFAFTGAVSAQNADEIITNYFENTGGYDAWGELEGIKMSAKFNQQGMEIPMTMVQLKGGKSYNAMTVQGMTLKQNVFDGETLWSTNFQTMKPEKSDSEMTKNARLNANDFPSDLYNYKDKGYSVELLGTEDFEGTETFKIKVTKEPMTIDGEEVEDVTYYYFDKDAYVPIGIESEVKIGPNKGMISRITMSDYQEVDGYYFPFSLTQGAKGGQSFPITIDSIEVNPEVSEDEFAFPEQ